MAPLRQGAAAKAKGDVGAHREVGKQRIPLEHVTQTTFLRRHVNPRRTVEQHPPVHDNPPGFRMDEPRQALERQRLAGAGRAEQDAHPVPGRPRHVEGEAVQCQSDLYFDAFAHVVLVPSRPARKITTHETTVSAATNTKASALSPLCTAV